MGKTVRTPVEHVRMCKEPFRDRYRSPPIFLVVNQREGLSSASSSLEKGCDLRQAVQPLLLFVYLHCVQFAEKGP